MANKIVKFNGKTLSGLNGNGIAIQHGSPTITIRFQFNYYIIGGRPQVYDPSLQNWPKGKWTKIEDKYGYYVIWDWTYTGFNASNPFHTINHTSLPVEDIEIISINCTSEITNISSLFKECYGIEAGIESAYNTLSQLNVTYTDCFKFCGLNRETGAQEMTKVPETWGGLKPLTGNGIKIGDYIWDNSLLGSVDIPNMIELNEYDEYNVGDIGYYYNYDDDNYYYTPEAVYYMIEHPEILPNGWHIPTLAEAQNFEQFMDHEDISKKAIFNTYGNNGFDLGITYNPEYDEEYMENEGILKYDDSHGWVHSSTGYSYITQYIINDGYISIYLSYGTYVYVNTYSYRNETGTLYPVRLVRDHD